MDLIIDIERLFHIYQFGYAVQDEVGDYTIVMYFHAHCYGQ